MRTNCSLIEVRRGISQALTGKVPYVRIMLEDGEKLGVFLFEPPHYVAPDLAWWADHIICQNSLFLPEELRERASLHDYAGLLEVRLEVSSDQKTIIVARKVLMIS